VALGEIQRGLSQGPRKRGRGRCLAWPLLPVLQRKKAADGLHSGRATPSLHEPYMRHNLETTSRSSTYKSTEIVQPNPASSPPVYGGRVRRTAGKKPVRGILKRMGQVVCICKGLAYPLTLPALAGQVPPSPASGRVAFRRIPFVASKSRFFECAGACRVAFSRLH
jgi:hypothetical protein